MATWSEVTAAVPELAAAARERFDGGRHKVLATLRLDGAPRVSGVETTFTDGELWLGMMPDSRKGADLRRDPRMALHSASPDPDDDHPSDWLGDAKVAGSAIAEDDPAAKARFVGTQEQMPEGSFELFRVDVAELTVIRVGTPADHLLIETWTTDGGIRRVQRH